MARRPAEPPTLEEAYSLSVADFCARTGWSKSQIYRELSSGGAQILHDRPAAIHRRGLAARPHRRAYRRQRIKPDPHFRGRDGTR
jgi:hypothetical protein